MPGKRREEGTPWWVWVYIIILFLLLLKALRVLPDPPEYIEIIASIGTAAGVSFGFGWIFTLLYKIQGRLTTVEVKLGRIEKDLDDVKNELKIYEDDLVKLKTKLDKMLSDVHFKVIHRED